MYAEERQHAIATLVSARAAVAVTNSPQSSASPPRPCGGTWPCSSGWACSAACTAGPSRPARCTSSSRASPSGTATRADNKIAIAAAADRVLPGAGGSLLLDAGTTTAGLAEVAAHRPRLYVATNSVPIAGRLGSVSPGITLHVLGGRVQGRHPDRGR